MDQYDYLTRDQLVSLVRALGAGSGMDRAPAPGNPDDLPVFTERARREFESSVSPMRIFDHKTMKFLAVNDAAVKFYGYTREEFLELTMRATRHPDEHGVQLESLKKTAGYFRYGPPRRQLKKSGEIAVVEVITQDLIYERRRARLTLTMDITQRLRMQELLWQRQQEFESLAENLPDLIARFDCGHRYAYVNSAVEELTGKQRGDILGRTQRELGLAEDIVTAFDDSLAEVIRTGRSHKLEFRYPVRGSERLFEAYHVPERDASGLIGSVLCVARDVTEYKHAELDARRSAGLAGLLESLARAANEALTPEAAMVACLERVCLHGHWVLGRVEIFDRGRPRETPGRSIWHAPEGNRFDEFIRITDSYVRLESGPFIGRVLRERAAVWIEDWRQKTGYRRREAIVRHGLRSAFAFPIIVHGEIAAIMEVFSEEVRPPDTHLVGAAQSIASQLARIVERESAQQANARMAAIVKSSQDAIVSRKLDGTVLTWNPGAEQLFGYTAAEIVGRKIETLYPSEIKAEMLRRQELLRQGHATPAYETVRLAKDGRRVHVSTSPSLIRDSSGNILGVSTIVRDNTERMRAEQALRESEERFRQLAENMDQVFWINTPAFDSNLYVSPAYEKVWGRSVESLRRNPNSWRESILPEDLPKLKKAVDEMALGKNLDIEYRISRPDGSVRWIRDRSYPMKAGDGTELACGIAEDVTDLKHAEQERLTHAIQQRDALVREVHHRIKNSLQGVAGLLRQKIRKFPDVAPSIEEAIVQLQSVAVVYGLQGARADGLLGLAEMVEAICASVEGLIGGRVDRVFERESARPVCVAGSEAVSMAVALNELIFNALKHQSAPAGKKRAQLVLRETRDAAEIRITNHGRLPKKFDFSGERALGNGLGLVRTLLASPGASVEFTSGRNGVEVLLKLRPPLLAERQAVHARREGNDGTSEEKAATAHSGRR